MKKPTNQAVVKTSSRGGRVSTKRTAPDATPQPAAFKSLSKTPMFTAANAARYQRQSLIREIEAKRGATLICYVSGDGRQIERDDVFGFVDLLHNIASGTPIDLVLHTLGGDVDIADKIMEQIRARLGADGHLRVIVPNYAKSAGTLMALGGDTIVMSDSSELGMIDPQYVLKDDRGNEICTSVIAYLEAYKEHFAAVQRNPSDQASQMMLQQFDPVVVRKFQGHRDRTRDIALRLLNRRGAASTQISEALMDLSRWKSHGQMIGHADARQLGLNVDYLSADEEVWQMLWHLLCLQRLEVDRDKKVFESAYVSQVFER